MQEQNKEKIREEIQKYERYKALKSIGTMGMLGSGALSAYGKANGNNSLAALGIGSAFMTGFLRGHASQEEDMALRKIKRHYDLRDNPFINFSAILPPESSKKKSEKVAIDMHSMSQAIQAIPPALAVKGLLAAAIAKPVLKYTVAVPEFARLLSRSGRATFSTMLKQTRGHELTPGEHALVGAGNIAQGILKKIDQMKPGLKKRIAENVTTYLGPLGMGAHTGAELSPAIREVEKISPRYADLLINAAASNEGISTLKQTAKNDASIVRGAMDRFKSETMLGKALSGAASGPGENLLKQVAENPQILNQRVDAWKAIEHSFIDGGAALLAAGVAGGVGHLAGQYRRKHPLAEDELPSRLSSMFSIGKKNKP